MYYIKNKIGDNIEVRTEIHGDDVYTKCGKCNKEILVDTSILVELLEEGNLDGTSICCEECSAEFVKKN